MADSPIQEPAAEPPQLGAALRPQTVIDAQCADFAAMQPRPAVGQNCQCQAVRTARDGDREKRGVFEPGEPAKGFAQLADAEGRRPGHRFSTRAAFSPASPGF